jgi:aerobic carbon-monoxide dehydrogenase large subunit
VYRRLVADYLGIPAEMIEVAHGDSDAEVPSAAVASRSTMSVGGAIAGALDAVIEKGERLAAHVLEASEADIQYRAGVFEITGTDRNIALFELAERAKQLGDSLDAKSSFDAAPSFPNGVHIAEVEIDPATGRTTLAAYTCVDDCGRVL